MCGKDDTKIAVYNLEECTEKMMGFFLELWYNLLLEENHMNQNNIVDSDFDNLVCVISSWIVKFNLFSSKINLVLLPSSTNLLFESLTFEPNPVLGSIQFQSLQK